jgi:hypothetical protein
LKVDFGVHVKGTIVDSAFTMNFEPTWNRLLEAVKDATNTGVRVCQTCIFGHLRLTPRLPDLMSECAISEKRSRKSWSLMKSK